MSQIDLYKKNNTNFSYNGDVTLIATQSTHNFKQNELTVVIPIDDEGRWEMCDFDDVIKVIDNGKDKYFRIYDITKVLDSITILARPLFYDLRDQVILHQGAQTMTGAEALAFALQGTQFTAHSNVTRVGVVDWDKLNIVEALLGDDPRSFVSVFGGDLDLHLEGFDVYLNDHILNDRGVRIELGKNLLDFEININSENVITRIVPTSKDNIMLDGTEPWVDSPKINNYPHPKMRVETYNDIYVRTSATDTKGFATIEEVKTELTKRAQDRFTIDEVDEPIVNFTVEMTSLKDYIDFEDVADLLTVNGGDTLTVNIPKYNILNHKVRVIDYDKNLLNGEYESITLGSETSNFLENSITMQHTVNKITTKEGGIKAESLQGTINGLQTQFKVSLDSATQMDTNAILFENKDETSNLFGALAIGTQGFMIANSYIPNTTDWNFRTFGTANGLVATEITTGTMSADRVRTGNLQSTDGKININLDNGVFSLSNANGEVIIDASSKIHKIVSEGTTTMTYNGKNTTKEIVHNLNYKPAFSAYQMGADGVDQFTQLPALTWANGVSAIIRARCDSTKLYFDFNAISGAIANGTTITIKYFIYEEVAF